MTQDPNGTLEQCKLLLEFCGKEGLPLVVFEVEYGQAGFEAGAELRRDLPDAERIPIVGVPGSALKELFIAMAPDQQARFRAGEPILIDGIHRDQRPLHPRHAPPDTDEVAAAKTALEVGVFELHAAQSAVELSRNTRRRNLILEAARDRAQVLLANAVWSGGRRVGKGPISRLKGLLDRGRRKAAKFFGMAEAAEVERAVREAVDARIASASDDVRPAIEDDIQSRATALAKNEARATAHERAMYNWNRSVEAGKPIEGADLRNVANAHADRQNATELARVAIAGNVNPAWIHRNLTVAMTTRFELAVKLGQLMRGQEIKFSPQDAATLGVAIQTTWRGPPDTDRDGADYYLVDAAARSFDSREWRRLMRAVAQSGRPATVSRPREPGDLS